MRMYRFAIAALALAGCVDLEPPRRISERWYTADGEHIRETVDRTETLQDPIFRRRVEVARGPRMVLLSDEADESRRGIEPTRPPRHIDGNLVVFTACHLVVETPAGRLVRFNPWQARGFAILRRDGIYGLSAADVAFDGDTWRARYVPSPGYPAGEDVWFLSEDAGATWRVDKAGAARSPAKAPAGR